MVTWSNISASSAGEQIGVLGMAFDVRGRERAGRGHRESSLADVLQRARDKLAADAVPLELLGDLGVEQDEAVRARLVEDIAGDLAVDAGLVAVLAGVVGDLDRAGLAHPWNPISRWVPSQNGLFRDWPQRQNAA